jgi:hypothetical protein
MEKDSPVKRFTLKNSRTVKRFMLAWFLLEAQGKGKVFQKACDR